MACLQSKRAALLASIQELEAQYEELRAEMLPLWKRHIALTEALPADLQQVHKAPSLTGSTALDSRRGKSYAGGQRLCI